MKYLIILLIFLSSCMSNDISPNINKGNNLFDMTLDEYNKMLETYNKNQTYPNIDN